MDKAEKKTDQSFKITGDWTKQSKKLREKYSQLTESDVEFETGKENELLKRVESRLNKPRKEIINIINKEAPAKAGF